MLNVTSLSFTTCCKRLELLWRNNKIIVEVIYYIIRLFLFQRVQINMVVVVASATFHIYHCRHIQDSCRTFSLRLQQLLMLMEDTSNWISVFYSYIITLYISINVIRNVSFIYYIWAKTWQQCSLKPRYMGFQKKKKNIVCSIKLAIFRIIKTRYRSSFNSIYFIWVKWPHSFLSIRFFSWW